MKREINKISMMVVATFMFMGAMFLSIEDNGDGKWEFAMVKAIAQGGEEPPHNCHWQQARCPGWFGQPYEACLIVGNGTMCAPCGSVTRTCD